VNISIIGAAGGVGREIAIQLVRDHTLENNETLQLIGGDPHSPHPHLLQGLRADLLDAYAEIAPEIEVIDDLTAIKADLVIMTAGETFATAPEQIGHASRDELAASNFPIFERFARSVAAITRAEPPLCIIVSNPVELAVHVFAEHLPREYVVGMGSHSDSLRFRAEIACDLGVRRQRVQGYVVGEHGAGMVPLWSSVGVAGMPELKADHLLEQRLKAIPAEEFPDRLAEATKRFVTVLREGGQDGLARAYSYIDTLPPELRVALKPLATHYTEAKTIVGTAHATLDLIRWILHGRAVEVSVQYQHRGERDCDVPFGARVIMAGKVEQLLSTENYTSAELALMRLSQATIRAKLDQWCGRATA
jgi:malate dehydrogenase